jgi:hypothetical protein
MIFLRKRLGSPAAGITDENVEDVQQLVHIDQRMTISTVAEETRMGKQNAVQSLTFNRRKKKIHAKRDKRNLTDDHSSLH